VVDEVTDDNRWPDALVDTGLPAETLRRAVYERTSPTLDVTVEPLVFEGVTLLKATVPERLGGSL